MGYPIAKIGVMTRWQSRRAVNQKVIGTVRAIAKLGMKMTMKYDIMTICALKNVDIVALTKR
jgi:hypothetical protein